MINSIRSFLRNIPLLLTIVIANSTPHGSILGIYVRRLTRRLNIHQIVGVNLAGFAFFSAIVLPQSRDALSTLVMEETRPANVVILEQSAGIYQWPLTSFGVSQEFSLIHPGMDLTDPIGMPVYPIADGSVAWVQSIAYGYGNHIFVQHDNGTSSLYAHLSRTDVRQGDRVTKKTQLGLVGVTGWTTGSHLHLEVYQNNLPANPEEILPEIHIPTAETASLQ